MASASSGPMGCSNMDRPGLRAFSSGSRSMGLGRTAVNIRDTPRSNSTTTSSVRLASLVICAVISRRSAALRTGLPATLRMQSSACRAGLAEPAGPPGSIVVTSTPLVSARLRSMAERRVKFRAVKPQLLNSRSLSLALPRARVTSVKVCSRPLRRAFTSTCLPMGVLITRALKTGRSSGIRPLTATPSNFVTMSPGAETGLRRRRTGNHARHQHAAVQARAAQQGLRLQARPAPLDDALAG